MGITRPMGPTAFPPYSACPFAAVLIGGYERTPELFGAHAPGRDSAAVARAMAGGLRVAFHGTVDKMRRRVVGCERESRVWSALLKRSGCPYTYAHVK